MPRGGGGRSGGARGGFGGGFRGGGMRGGGGGFRTGSYRPSGTPFGRTGSTRIVSRSPSGPYRHTYYRPHPRYYRRWYYPRYWYSRPWYWRWWYSPYWIGRWWRPWYYSPVYIGGGFILFIVSLLIILPLFGVAFILPFSNATPTGNVIYRSTETIYFNEYWYEYEYIESGSDITYSVQSSPSVVTFAIWDQPFENLPRNTKYGNYSETFGLQQDLYEYYSLYLRPGSSIDYEFNATIPIDFFIADANQFYQWDQESQPNFAVEFENTTSNEGTYSITEAKDYYLVWYNQGNSTSSVSFSVNYTATSVVDFSATDIFVEAVNTVSQDKFTVPNDGEWYFFVYFDPMNSLEESTTITFDVSYDTGVSTNTRWFSIFPILIVILVIVVVIIVVASYARKGQKQVLKKQQGTAPTTSPYAVKKPEKVEKPEESQVTTKKCVRCGSSLKPDANFCTNCGGKVEGRSLGESSVTTPAKSVVCSYCGSNIKEGDSYCRWCGTKVAE